MGTGSFWQLAVWFRAGGWQLPGRLGGIWQFFCKIFDKTAIVLGGSFEQKVAVFGKKTAILAVFDGETATNCHCGMFF